MASPPQMWAAWLDRALLDLEHHQLNRRLLPISYSSPAPSSVIDSSLDSAQILVKEFGIRHGCAPGNVQIYEDLGPWDRETVEVEVSMTDFQDWLEEAPCTGQQVCNAEVKSSDEIPLGASNAHHKMLLFSGNDYLGLSAHPSVRAAAARASLECGMGPRAAALICGYTDYHRRLEVALAELKHTEDCLLCPTGFAANMAVMTALSSIIRGSEAAKEGAFAIFSDALNHASIIDGVRLAQKLGQAEVYQYRHSDMSHLEHLLLNCKLERKVVVTDSLFSMDGDFAPVWELAALRKKYNFILVLDDAHGTLVCGENGGGVAEAFGVEEAVDICVGTLSKAFGCHGGFIATSRKWKQWIQSRGRSFIFSTSLPIPVVAAAHAAIVVARNEKWRQLALWDRVRQLSIGLGVELVSHIAPIIIGGADEALAASRELLKRGFHVFAIRPPTVPHGSSRLRITLSAAHTEADVAGLLAALPPWINEKANTQLSLILSSSPKWRPSTLQSMLDYHSGLIESTDPNHSGNFFRVPVSKLHPHHNAVDLGPTSVIIRTKM